MIERDRKATIVEGEPLGTRAVVPLPVTPQESPRTLTDALAHARLRGEEAAARILKGDDMLSADALADRLAVSRESINTWRKQRERCPLIRLSIAIPATDLRSIRATGVDGGRSSLEDQLQGRG